MYEKLQKVWLEETGVKVGDKVKVLREFEDYEVKASINWNPKMSKTIGEIGEVFRITSYSIRVNFSGEHWLYPFTVLEKVEIEQKIKPDVPDTNRNVLFLNNSNEWEIGFYCSRSGCWKVRGVGSLFLKLADGEVVRWEELPSKEKKEK